MDGKITAEWARNHANNILGVKVKMQLEQCERGINAAVKINKMSCDISMYAESLTIKELTSRGFTCKQQDGYDQRDPAYLNIKW